jgi:cobalt-zinc-cadmium efflux system outer membrane protein
MLEIFSWWRIASTLSIVSLLGLPATPRAQASAANQAAPLTLSEARARARAVDANLAAAAEAIAAAQARARQAGAMQNPVLSWSREQASRTGLTNTQDIVTLEQRVDVGGVRNASRAVALLAAAARAASAADAASQLDYAVAESFWRVVVADLRGTAISRVLADYALAAEVSRARLAAGDISAYADRRLQVEVARLEARNVEAEGERERTRLFLHAILNGGDHVTRSGALAVVVDTLLQTPVTASADSLVGLALTRRADIRATLAMEDAARAGVSLARRERIPLPGAMLGYKRERVGSDPSTLSGLVVGLSLPVPLWDRRGGAIGAAEAGLRLQAAEVEAARRTARRQVLDALTLHQSAVAQLERVALLLTDETLATLAAIDVAYAEGEATLVEWLDAKRAWLDLQLLRADVLEDYLISRAALERAVGGPLA